MAGIRLVECFHPVISCLFKTTIGLGQISRERARVQFIPAKPWANAQSQMRRGVRLIP